MSDTLSIVVKNNVEIISHTTGLGAHGERLAVRHLGSNGYQVVMTNFKVPVGRNSKGVAVTGEIDIVALDGETLCFVEVKTRRSDEFTRITTNVDLRKQRQITRTAKVYRRIFNLWDMPHRFDVVTVLMPKHSEPAIEIIKNFWSEARFAKRTWNDQAWQEYP
ncbi:MAG TPA: YraN family protein [Pyrinomonadaceae bacterium]|nr:YraN family protein [Pyrinomonadaceae bacterium]